MLCFPNSDHVMVLQGICLLFLHTLCIHMPCINVHRTHIWEKQFSRVASRGLIFVIIIALLSSYALFSQFRPGDVLQGICLLFLHKLCIHMLCINVHRTHIWEKQFSRVPSRGLKGNKTYKLKRSIAILFELTLSLRRTFKATVFAAVCQYQHSLVFVVSHGSILVKTQRRAYFLVSH